LSSWALYLADRTTILPNTGCLTRRSTLTTTVLSILLLTTRPTSVRWRLTGAVWVSLISLSCVLSLDGVDAGDVATHLAQLAGVGKLLGGALHTQVEMRLQQAFKLGL